MLLGRGFWVYSLGVQGIGLGVPGFRLRLSGFRVLDFRSFLVAGFRALGFKVYSLGFWFRD